MKKILFVSEGYGKKFFGVAQVLMRLVAYCRKAGFSYEVLVIKAKDIPEKDVAYVKEIPVQMLLRHFRHHLKQLDFFTSEMNELSPSVVHIHGVMTFVQRNAVRAAKKRNIPVIISPHGMLEPWMWLQKGKLYYWLKRLYWILVLRPVLRRADFTHAITEQESETLKKEFPNIPQVRISNAIDLSEYTVEQAEPDKSRYLLFLGRLHPVKGVDVLLEAFARAKLTNMRLIIAGPDFDLEYTVKLKTLVGYLECLGKVSFIGPITGEKKDKLLKAAWCVVVPSYSEVIAMVNLEAAASYVPTVTTNVTGLSDWEEGGGLLIDPVLVELTSALITVANWTEEERMQRGKASRELVEQRYNWDVIGEQWIEAYNMIAKEKYGS